MGYNKVTAVEVTVISAVLVSMLVSGGLYWILLYYQTVNNSAESKVQQVSGNQIVDENGSEVVWRGAGGSYLFHADERYQEAWQLHLPQIQAMGLNTIRLAFAFADSGVNPDYGTPTADVLSFHKLDWVLDFLGRNGVKVILDCHNYGDMFGDFGSQKLIDDWVAVAERYRGDSRIVAYELFNEPASRQWAPSVTSKMDVLKAYAELTDAVRAVDPEHIVIWESAGYLPYGRNIEKFAEVVKPYLRPNIVFTRHEWLHKESDFDVWNPEQQSYMIVDYLVWARSKLGVPFWLGEFGSYQPFNRSNPEYQWTEQTLWRCEEQVIGWNLWSGRIEINKYLSLFPLKVHNANLTRKNWILQLPTLRDYVVDSQGVEKFETFQIEMWHNHDFVTFKPGIIIRVITNHKLPDETFEVVSDETIEVTQQLTIHNEEGTEVHPGDWNTKIYSTKFAS